jgi:hypothetical protein
MDGIALDILSRDIVTIEGVSIGDRIYEVSNFKTRKYK